MILCFVFQESVIAMAWLTVAYSNEELCDKLVAYDILQPDIIQEAFRVTDRGDFVPDEFQ